MRIAAGIHPSLNLVDMTAESFVKNSEAISAAAPTVCTRVNEPTWRWIS